MYTVFSGRDQSLYLQIIAIRYLKDVKSNELFQRLRISRPFLNSGGEN